MKLIMFIASLIAGCIQLVLALIIPYLVVPLLMQASWNNLTIGAHMNLFTGVMIVFAYKLLRGSNPPQNVVVTNINQ